MPPGLPRLWPRRLRWRLVLGFALTVALLQAVLTGTERLLLEGALVGSIRQSLQTSVNTGLASPLLGPRSGSVGGVLTVFARNVLGGPSRTSKKAITLLAAPDTAALAKALALPDQPVAMLDTRGRLYARAGTLSGDRARPHPLEPVVTATLLAVARGHLTGGRGEWTQQVATGDGPYLLLLRQTDVVLPPPLARQEQDLVLKTLKGLGLVAGGPDPGTKMAVARLLDRAPRLVVMIARRLGETEQTVATVTAISLGGSLAAIVLAALLSLAVVGRALRPLAAITRGAERLAEGDYRYRLHLAVGTDEIGRLSTAFDRMATAIGDAFATQRRFVADASHELRTPLTALRGYTDVLLMGADEDRATTERILDAMQEDLGRMSRLVDDLLTLARLDGGTALQLSPIVVSDLLGAAAREGRALTRGRQQIVEGVVPAQMVVWGDRDRLRQVLSNLVGNACAYCPPESLICLRARVCAPWAVVEVQDDGPGIPAADLPRLGERFYRGDTARSRQSGGSGLGLAIARAIVEAHGGTLALASTVGEGTTVTIHLPLATLLPPSLPSATALGSPRT